MPHHGACTRYMFIIPLAAGNDPDEDGEVILEIQKCCRKVKIRLHVHEEYLDATVFLLNHSIPVTDSLVVKMQKMIDPLYLRTGAEDDVYWTYFLTVDKKVGPTFVTIKNIVEHIMYPVVNDETGFKSIQAFCLVEMDKSHKSVSFSDGSNRQITRKPTRRHTRATTLYSESDETPDFAMSGGDIDRTCRWYHFAYIN